jgi:hypothetical protein
MADPSGHAVTRLLGLRLISLGAWNVVCHTGREISATGRSIVQKIPTECVCVCVCHSMWSGASITLHTLHWVGTRGPTKKERKKSKNGQQMSIWDHCNNESISDKSVRCKKSSVYSVWDIILCVVSILMPNCWEGRAMYFLGFMWTASFKSYKLQQFIHYAFLFVFLALQPIVVVFSQPSGGL